MVRLKQYLFYIVEGKANIHKYFSTVGKTLANACTTAYNHDPVVYKNRITAAIMNIDLHQQIMEHSSKKLKAN